MTAPESKPREHKQLGRQYWLLWSASSVSNLGDGLRFVAFPLLAATLTRDPLLVAGVVVVEAIPWLTVGLVGGALADRVNRRTAMIASNVIRLAISAAFVGLVLTDNATIVTLYAMVFAMASVETVFDSAAQALIPTTVNQDQLARANSRLLGARHITNRLIGPAVGGALFMVLPALPLIIDTATFALALVFLVRLARTDDEHDGRVDMTTLLRDTASGFRWLWNRPILVKLALLAAGTNGVLMLGTAVLVLFAEDTLGLDGTGFGLLLAVAALGSLIGTAVAEKIIGHTGLGWTIVGALIAFAVFRILFGLSTDAVLAGVLTCVTGACALVWHTAMSTYQQTVVPNQLLGRVFSVFRTMSWLAALTGALLGGIVARISSPGTAIVAGGILLLVIGLVSVRLVPRISRTLEEPTAVQCITTESEVTEGKDR